MSERPNLTRKRTIEEDDSSGNGSDVGTADAATLAQRRMVRGKRTEPTGSSSFRDAFKSAPGALPGSVPSLSTNFTDNANNTTNSDKNINAAGGGTAQTTASGAKTFFSFASKSDGEKTAPASFSAFSTATATAAASSSSPFSAAPTTTTTTTATTAATTVATKPVFSFGTKPTGDGAAPTFSFASFSPAAGTGGTHAAPLFNFKDAANSFVMAKKRQEEERAAKAACNNDGGRNQKDEIKENNNGNDDNDPTTAEDDTASEPVIASAGDNLASIASRLYIFKAETKTWVECGMGDAKVKRHEAPGQDGKYVYRIIVRNGYSLNAPLNANFRLVKAEDKLAAFAIPMGDGIATYLLKYIGQHPERGAEFSKVLKQTLDLAVGSDAGEKK